MRLPRLGKGVDANKTLALESMQRVIDVLKEYKQMIDNQGHKVKQVILCATSAVRDASNRQAFVDLVQKELNYDVTILPGKTEALCTFTGAVGALKQLEVTQVNQHYNLKQLKYNIAIDIGGGSTEVAIGTANKLVNSHSFDMGCVRYAERYFFNPNGQRVEDVMNYVPTADQINSAHQAIKDTLKGVQFQEIRETQDKSLIRLIGVEGTFASICCIANEYAEMIPAQFHGSILTLEQIESQLARFRTMSPNQMLALYPKILFGRADVYLIGLLIASEFMKEYGFSTVQVSTGGIRYGGVILRTKNII
jgi:exopolyphosphatase/guanosine-5'-triphosphate,3'-diphosphate pyrophosphatase